MSALDAEFLYLEDGIAHLHIGGVAVFGGPILREDELRRLLVSKLHLIPRYRQRVRTVPLDLGRPVWVDDPYFNLEYHIRHTAVPAPGDDATLCRLVGRLMSQPLDRNRPLWELWLVEGLADDRWAMIFKVHHCMVDGVSGVDLLGILLDVEPDADLPEPQPWEPEPEPSGAARVLDAWMGLAGDIRGRVAQVPGIVRDPFGAMQSARRVAEGVVTFGQHLGANPMLSIEGAICPFRAWAHAESSLEDVRMIRKAFGGTVNDVVLAAVSGGYRSYLASRGDDPDTAVLRSLVPVSVRDANAHDHLDNRVSAILYELPVRVGDPVTRLRIVERQMSALKASPMADAGEAVTTIGDFMPPMVVGAMSRWAVRLLHQLPQRSVNTVTTNVPGPQFPLYCLGHEMLAYHPFVPLSHGVQVGTAILSYNGQLSFGVTGDFDAAGDVGVLADEIAAGISELRALA